MAKSTFRIEGQDGTLAAFRSALGNAQSTANKMSGAFKAAFAGISVAMIVGMGRGAIETGDNLNKLAIRAKLAGKEASTLAYAAKQSDIELDALTTGVQKMQIWLSKAASGEKGAAEGLDAIGIKLKDIKDLRSDQQFELIADGISRLKNEEDQARAVTEIFGKAGGALLPMFQQGAAGIRAARQEAEKLGLAFSDEQLKKLADADDSLKRLDSSWHAMWITVTSKVAPGISAVADAISGLDTRSIDEKIKDLEQLTKPRRGNFAADRARAQVELDRLRALRDIGSIPEAFNLGGRGGIRGKGSDAPGYKPDTSAADAAAKKAREAEEKAVQEMVDYQLKLNEDLNKQLQDQNQETFDHEFEAAQANQEFMTEAMKETQEKMDEWRREQNEKISEGAQIFRDGFRSAFEDMIHTGKIKWDELLKYLAAEFALKGFDKLFDNVFKASDGSSSGGGGVWDWVTGALKSVFGGSRDSGGRGKPGHVYDIGIGAQPERFIPDGPGTFVPRGGAGGRSVVIHQNNTFHGTGGDQRSYERAMRENNRRLVDELDRTNRLVPA